MVGDIIAINFTIVLSKNVSVVKKLKIIIADLKIFVQENKHLF